MERLSFDVDHIQRSEILRRHKPSHVSEGLRNGLSGLGLSILGMVCCVLISKDVVQHSLCFVVLHYTNLIGDLLAVFCMLNPTRNVS